MHMQQNCISRECIWRYCLQNACRFVPCIQKINTWLQFRYMSDCETSTCNSSVISTPRKWLTFCRRHFQCIFFDGTYSHFDVNFTEVLYQGTIQQ